MRHSWIFALPAVLRPAVFLAGASQHSFSVNDDLFAYPQYEVRFSEDWISETVAQSKLDSNDLVSSEESPASDVEHYRPSDQQPASDDSKKTDDILKYEKMKLGSEQYLCSIPQVAPPSREPAANDTLTKQEEEKELARANDRGWELLSGMQGQCVYFISGWWSYKFCYNDGVRQFHQLPPSRGIPPFPPIEDSSVPGFTLGSYQKETPKKDGKASQSKEVEVSKQKPPTGELVQRGETRYLVQKLKGGTTCDLTGEPRRIDVQFHCNPSSADRISLIKESSTCAYLMVIQTPRLCNDVAFLPPQKADPHAITCTPILSSPADIADYERDIAALREVEQEARIWAEQPEAADVFLGPEETEELRVAGDIAIGARRIVPEGVTLEKSAIVGGGKETYIDTIADSAGKVLGKAEREKLGLGDAKALERLTKRLKEMAGGQEWKLDVVETAQGREYRGVIGKDDKEDGGEAGEAGKEGSAKEGGDGDGEGETQGEGGEEGSEEEFYREEL